MARITRADVEHVAGLARLSLSDDEVASMAADLDTVLEYAELLQELDTSEVEPTAHPVPLATPMREDVAVPGIDPRVALANAPEQSGDAFVVPGVMGDDDSG